MNKIQEVSNITPEEFINEVLPAGKPLVMRGLVNDWPIVQAAKISNIAFCDYLKKFDRDYELDTMTGPASIKGRIFYNSDISGLNSRMGKSKLTPSLDYILEHAQDDPAPLLAMQSVVISQYLPGLQLENKLSLLPDAASPRIWIGGRAIVAAHYDPSENIACCVAGRRRFTLLPPEQVSNLYIGPYELTPAGPTISMVDFNNPDYHQHPKFKLAQTAALTAELFPGDALYIPYLWWHHVEALDSINALVNYWWNLAKAGIGDPRGALLHAVMSVKNLPDRYRHAWQSQFEHYVFQDDVSIHSHIPEERRGILGDTDADSFKKLRQSLAKSLNQ
jgi:hypothetical protein